MYTAPYNVHTLNYNILLFLFLKIFVTAVMGTNFLYKILY